MLAQRPRARLRASTRSRVFWCHRPTASSAASWSRCTTPTASGTPTSSDPTARPGRAPTRSSTSRRSTTSTATTTIAVPPPGERLARRRHPAPRRRPLFIATLTGTADRHAARRRATLARAPAAPCSAWSGSSPRHLAVAAWPRGPAPARPPATGRRLDDRPSPRSAPGSTPRWPDLDTVPLRPQPTVCARGRAALFRGRRRRLPVRVELARRRPLGRRRSGSPTMRIHRPTEFFRRLGARRPDRLRRGLHGRRLGRRRPRLASSPSSPATLPTLVPAPLQTAARARTSRAAPRAERNTPRTTRASNIARHYDLSNDLFALFLDETMSYSSALFDTRCDRGDHLRPRRPRADAIDLAGAGPQDRPAARPGRRRRGHPRARDRHRLGRAGHPRRPARRHRALGDAVQRAARAGRASGSPTAGVADRVTVELLRLPRASQGSTTRSCRVEMIEAVGYEYWPTYFATSTSCSPRAAGSAIQAITMPHDRMLATRNTYTWINKYIFPGGFLPSVDGDRRDHPRPTPRCGIGDRLVVRPALRADTAALGRAFLAAARRGARRSGSTRRSAGCGTSTWSTRGPASRPATSTCSRSRCIAGALMAATIRVRARTVDGRGRAARGRTASVRRRRAAGPAARLGRLRGRARRTRRSVDLRSRDALRRLLWHPGELGAAQAYVTGELEVEGDLDAALTHVWTVGRRARADRACGARRATLAGAAARGPRSASLGPPAGAPDTQARVRGRLHSRRRDRRRSATTTTCPTSSTR